MSASAKVQSIAVLREFRTALCAFVEAARSSLGEAEADLQRHAGWLSDDREQHWRFELTRRGQQFQQAKLALLAKKLQKTSTGGRPSCVDEEKALAQAQRRLEEAQQKAESTKKWVRRLEEQVFQQKGLLQALSLALDNDAVSALALLDRLTATLDKYIALAPPPGMDVEAASSEAGGMARPVDEPPGEAEDAKRQAQGDGASSPEPAAETVSPAEASVPEKPS